MPDETGGGDFQRGSELEARVALLEAAVNEIRVELKAIRGELTALRIELGEMRGEMRGRFANLPTTFQLVFMQSGFILAAFAAAFGLLKLAGLH
jgi:hypothetical protein